MKSLQQDVHLFLLGAIIAVAACVAGCERKETVLDVDTPNGGIEIQRDKDGGGVTVEVGE